MVENAKKVEVVTPKAFDGKKKGIRRLGPNMLVFVFFCFLVSVGIISELGFRVSLWLTFWFLCFLFCLGFFYGVSIVFQVIFLGCFYGFPGFANFW